jgi:hypothetical protein
MWGGQPLLVPRDPFHFFSTIPKRTRKWCSLLEELTDTGFNPAIHIPGTFTPLGERTPSTVLTDLSDLSEDNASPRLLTTEPGSEEEVTVVLSQSATTVPMSQGVTTRSRTRAQAQAQNQAASSSVPHNPVANSQAITVPTPISTRPIPAAQPQVQRPTNLAAIQPVPNALAQQQQQGIAPAQQAQAVAAPNIQPQAVNPIQNMPLANLPA